MYASPDWPGNANKMARHWLHRGRLRDVIIILCAVSTYFFPASAAAIITSFLLLSAGCILHILVKGQLIRNVELCTAGAYAAVRNPYYLANYLIDAAFCLSSGNVYLVLLYPFLFFWAYGPTLREEEALLASMHGPAFESYRAGVPPVFPDASLWPSLRGIARGFSWRRITSGEIKRIARFVFIGTFLTLLQHLGPAGMQEIASGRNPLDGPGKILLAISAAFLVASFLIPRRGDL